MKTGAEMSGTQKAVSAGSSGCGDTLYSGTIAELEDGSALPTCVEAGQRPKENSTISHWASRAGCR